MDVCHQESGSFISVVFMYGCIIYVSTHIKSVLFSLYFLEIDDFIVCVFALFGCIFLINFSVVFRLNCWISMLLKYASVFFKLHSDSDGWESDDWFIGFLLDSFGVFTRKLKKSHHKVEKILKKVLE